MNQDDAARGKLWSVIKKYRFSMMTTGEGGALATGTPLRDLGEHRDMTMPGNDAVNSVVQP